MPLNRPNVIDVLVVTNSERIKSVQLGLYVKVSSDCVEPLVNKLKKCYVRVMSELEKEEVNGRMFDVAQILQPRSLEEGSLKSF